MTTSGAQTIHKPNRTAALWPPLRRILLTLLDTAHLAAQTPKSDG